MLLLALLGTTPAAAAVRDGDVVLSFTDNPPYDETIGPRPHHPPHLVTMNARGSDRHRPRVHPPVAAEPVHWLADGRIAYSSFALRP